MEEGAFSHVPTTPEQSVEANTRTIKRPHDIHIAHVDYFVVLDMRIWYLA